ncbi:MAG: Arc family DNA-binding protein [Anaerolineae bacterium]|nr:Arc family DNA-binding protein [Anaerolineae bacterium]
MTAFTVENIPPNIYEKLKRSAEINRRSINSEIIFCIEKVVRSQQISPELILARARKIREMTEHSPLTDEEFMRAKKAGRP